MQECSGFCRQDNWVEQTFYNGFKNEYQPNDTDIEAV